MSTENTDNTNLESTIQAQAARGIQSVTIDGMTTTFSSVQQAIQADQYLSKKKAARNPLSNIGLFKIKNTER